MKAIKLAVLSLGAMFTMQSHASQLCESRAFDFQEKLKSDSNLLTFANVSGPLKLGVCWWHTRMTRNATYLLDFRPQLAALSRPEALAAIESLTSPDKVVAVPGFKNLSEFSNQYRAEMQETLGQWQMSDSFLGFGWLKGLDGTSTTSAEALKATMDQLYENVTNKGHITYTMLKFPSVVAHAWLVHKIEKAPNGYKLTVVDSNAYGSLVFNYTYGMTNMYHGILRKDFVPNIQRNSDLSSIETAIHKTCEFWEESSQLKF